MKKCAFLSMDSLTGWGSYDHLLYEPFRKLGWNAEHVPWRRYGVDWNDYDAVIIRSTWDYQDDSELFLQTLEKINNSSAHLENNLELVKWNLSKTYLKNMQSKEVLIVPTLFDNELTGEKLKKYFDELDSHTIIIKPVISASAQNTFKISKQTEDGNAEILKRNFKKREFLVQPFMKNIVEEGEYSVFFFGDVYSHTILKTPKQNDFRVQEEHGGILKLVKPEEKMIRLATEIRALIKPDPLYSRIDFVRTDNDMFALMELELIEPSLYFNMDSSSPERFAKVFDRWMLRYKM